MSYETKAHRHHWNKKYQQGNTHAAYQADNDLQRLIHHFPTTGMALDLACGSGRNSFFLAEHGLDVVCLDFSSNGLEHLIHRAHTHENAPGKVLPLLADLSDFSFPAACFDAVVVNRYLDRAALKTYPQLLKPSGVLFFKAFNRNHLRTKPQFNPDYLLERDELTRAFAKQNVIASNDGADNQTDNPDEESMILIRKD